MKKLKTNIRYFMQLRQSPSMVLCLEKSEAPQSSHRGTPTRKNSYLIPPPWGGVSRGPPDLVLK